LNSLPAFDVAFKRNDYIAWLAVRHHKTHRNEYLNFSNHKYAKQIYFDKSKSICVIKSTQCGLTEYLTCRSIGHAISGLNVFYIMPTERLSGRFVKNRIDRSIAFTPYYAKVVTAITDQAIKNSKSVSLKHFGMGAVAYVGSNAPNTMTEFPADEVIIDEFDRCQQENLAMAWERLSHSDYRLEIKISNPTIEGFGIDTEYLNSDQKKWTITHDCGKSFEVDWFNNVVRKVNDSDYVLRDTSWKWGDKADINLICEHCEKPIDRFVDGKWVAHNKHEKSGYSISKLFSSKITIAEILERFNRGLADDAMMQRFYNGDLGKPYTAAGAKITEQQLDTCVSEYIMPNGSNEICVAGVDVGSMFHIIIIQVNPEPRTVFIGSVHSPEEVLELLSKYNVKSGVIDGLPERRVSAMICATHKGMVSCFYGGPKKDLIDFKHRTVSVDRTSALDNVKEAIITKSIALPRNAKSIPEFYDHVCASTRIYDEDANRGEGGYTWTEGSKPDHLFHAFAYALIAKRLMLMLVR
jgi:hypothetical protein